MYANGPPSVCFCQFLSITAPAQPHATDGRVSGLVPTKELFFPSLKRSECHEIWHGATFICYSCTHRTNFTHLLEEQGYPRMPNFLLLTNLGCIWPEYSKSFDFCIQAECVKMHMHANFQESATSKNMFFLAKKVKNRYFWRFSMGHPIFKGQHGNLKTVQYMGKASDWFLYCCWYQPSMVIDYLKRKIPILYFHMLFLNFESLFENRNMLQMS